jgi:hypothetical protein
VIVTNGGFENGFTGWSTFQQGQGNTITLHQPGRNSATAAELRMLSYETEIGGPTL